MECPRCGETNPRTHTFCEECGAILTQTGAASARPPWRWIGAIVGVCVLGLVAWLALSGGDDTGRADPTPTPDSCCKVCRSGTACGDTCIDADEACTEAAGCACQGEPCCKVCRSGKACGDTCIDRDATCAAEAGCACDAE